jgi:hypothetical protein
MVSLFVVVRHELVDGAEQSPLPRIRRLRHSSRIDRTNRSASALAFGPRTGVSTIRTPAVLVRNLIGPTLSILQRAVRKRRFEPASRPPAIRIAAHNLR